MAESLKLLEKKKIFQNPLCTKFDDDDDDDDVNNELNLCSRVPFLKLTVPQPVKKFATFFGTQRFINVTRNKDKNAYKVCKIIVL